MFTGNISRLSGRGTQGMSLKDHGPHIDAEPEDAVVKAKIQVEGIDEPFEIERHMSDSKELIYPDDIGEDILKEVLEIAEKIVENKKLRLSKHKSGVPGHLT